MNIKYNYTYTSLLLLNTYMFTKELFSWFDYNILRDVRVLIKPTNFIKFFFGLLKLFYIIKINNLYIFTVMN